MKYKFINELGIEFQITEEEKNRIEFLMNTVTLCDNSCFNCPLKTIQTRYKLTRCEDVGFISRSDRWKLIRKTMQIFD